MGNIGNTSSLDPVRCRDRRVCMFQVAYITRFFAGIIAT
jgi:hypothetical protein